MRAHRLINILLTIEQDKCVTACQLAKQLEVSTRTVYRDIEALCQAGIPIVAQPGTNGGLSLMEGYQTKIEHFEKDEIVSLFLNGIGIKSEWGSTFEQQSDTAYKKLLLKLPEVEKQKVLRLTGRFIVDKDPWWNENHPVRFVDEVIQAVCRQEKVKIMYQKVNQSVSERIIRPYGIVIKNHIWYLVAFCEKSIDIRLFRCERITDCTLLGEFFVYPEDFHLDLFFESRKRDFIENRNQAEQYPVTLSCNKKILYHLENIEFTVNEETEDTCIITINMYTLENALSDYWNVLISAKVLEPKGLREQVILQLQRTLQEY